MLRKLFTLIVCLVAAVATASAQTPPYNEIWYTTIDGRPLGINSGYKKSVGLYMYSDTYNNGRGVLKFRSSGYINFIYSGLFDGNYRLKSITIPNSVTRIGYEAFAGCSSLKSITIPNSVTEIGGWAFEGCSSLTSITIPNSVIEIGGYAFAGCSSLKSITIPDSVTSIESHAFEGCSNLTSITIPNSVNSIGYDAFEDCSNLINITTNDLYWYRYFKNKNFKTTFTGKNESSDRRYIISKGELVDVLDKKLTKCIIPNGVTSIAEKAFSGCSNLINITIPNSVTKIKPYAFEGCKGELIINCNIPDGYFDSNSSGYYQYPLRGSQFTKVTIGEGVTKIGDYAFKNCNSITSITIPDSVTEIGDIAFWGCTSLTSINIPESITEIEENAFMDSNLKSVKVANEYCYNYFKYEVDDIAFYGANASDDGRCLIIDGTLEIFIENGLTEYTIPNSVKSIGDHTFSDCSSIESITIPKSVTSIGKGAFKGCSNLKSFKGKFASEDGRCLIKDGELIAFAPAGLTSYTIPNSVTSIEYSAFAGCSSLKSVKVSNKYCYDYFKKLRVPDITFIVSTPKEYEEAHKLGATKLAIDSNSKYASEDGLCLIDNGKLILFIGKDLTEYTIPESATSIGELAFWNCSSLTSITIPNSVTSIGESAFKGCNSLKSITIPDSVTSIEFRAFVGCSSLTSITIPNSVTSIEYGAFQGCSSLTSITIPNSVTSIGQVAFGGCSSLKSITIPNSVTSIGRGAFSGCSSLTSITIGNSVTSIGREAFKGCSRLTSITIPDSVASIGDEAFWGCSSLTSIAIPNSITSIGSGAFNHCNSLTSITCLATTPPAIGNLSIGETTMIYVPKEAVKAYKKDLKWSIYKKQIKAIK